MSKKLYRLNDEERRIIELARQGDPDPFTDYYLRGPNTGTWWLPGAKRQPWKRGYALLHKYWLLKDRPDSFDYEYKTYRTFSKHERSREFPGEPAFHHNHGLRMLPYAKEFFVDRTPTRCIVGGRGSGKTLNCIVIPYLIWAAIYEDFRGFALAPEANQANEVLKLAWQYLQGTLYLERFIPSRNYTRNPNALLRVANDLVGQTTIECYPLLKHEDKLLTLTGDCAAVDQAEKFESHRRILEDVGPVFRGRVASTGRERIGTMSLVANSDYNDELWQIYDMAKEDPEHYKSITVTSYDNPYLTERDLDNFETFVGHDEEAIGIKLRGERPLGNGKEFSRDVLTRMRMPELDRQMDAGLNASLPGYSKQSAPNVGVHEWLLPYVEGHTYLVVSDPGTGDPPDRDAYGILIWDISLFPSQPATLAGFVWGFGKGKIINWANKHAEMVWRFKAIGRNAIDATGYQAGYDEWMSILSNLLVEKMSLSAGNKAHCLNAAKMLTAHELMKIPPSLTGLLNQLQRYDYHEETKRTKQDLVMAFIMSAKWMERLWFMAQGIDQQENDAGGDYDDRNYRPDESREALRLW